jgi:aminopeptidase N
VSLLHKAISRAALAVVVALSAAARAQPVPTGPLPDSVRPLAYTLELKVDPRADRFSGRVRIHLRLAAASDHFWMHARELDIGSARLIDTAGTVHDVTITTRDPTGVVEAAFGATLPAQEADLVVDYSAPFNRKLQGLYKVTARGEDYVVTQFESISARYAFPSFDEPRFKTPFDITLTVPKDDVAVANTLPKSKRVSADGQWKTVAYARTKPLPTYLVAVAVGPWDVVDGPVLAPTFLRPYPVPLRAIGPRGTGAQMHWILEQTPAIVKYFEDYTGQAYPFDKLDLLGAPDFAAGAMENAGLIVYRDALLRIDATSPAGTARNSFDVTAHEIAHQWFGDLVTVPWWNDIWLNEAFASWAQGKASVALHPEYGADLDRLERTLEAMGSDSLLSARRIRQPVANQGDIETAFDAITYSKGAAVLRMIEEWIGAEAYRKAMHDYLVAHAFGSGSSDDLIASIAKSSGKGGELAAAMRGFLDEPGIPLLRTALTCKEGRATLAVSQSRYLPLGVLSNDNLRWHVPMCLRLASGGASTTQCLLVDRPEQTFALSGVCPDWYLPNADGAGYYRFAMPPGQFAALGAHAGSLAPAEQMVFADAARSAFRRGDAGPAAVLDALRVLSRSGEPQVALALYAEIKFIREHMTTPATRPVFDAYVEQLYEPRLDRLGYRHRAGESDSASRLRQRLASMLGFDVRDVKVAKKLDAIGRVVLGLDAGDGVDLSRVDPDLRGFALKAAVQQSGKPAFEAVLAELSRTRATQERYELVAALGAAHDPALAARARDLGLTPQIAVGEFARLYFSEVGEPENRDAFWDWFQAHADALRARLPDFYQRILPRLPAVGRCDRHAADELEQWFAPRIDSMIGGRRATAQAIEGITQCTALRDHFGADALTKWAEARRAP